METNVLLGLGPGQCGFGALKELLSRQPQTKVTIEDAPILPWESDSKERRIRERLIRLRSSATGARLLCDIAAFYLPYVPLLLESEPNVRLLCLRSPVDAIVSGFESQLDSVARVPTNHWSEVLPFGWYHDPLWSRSFPKYKTRSRSEAISLYVRDYYQLSETFAAAHPDRFMLIDAGQLCDESTIHRILDFAGIPPTLQNLWVCPPDRLLTKAGIPRRYNEDVLDPRKCVILVPFGMFIHQECDAALKELERRGYEVRRVGGYAAIDQGRNQMATDALMDGFEETFWIDSDVGFHPDDVEKVRKHNLPIVCGIYPQKGKRALACHVAPTMPAVTFGKEGALIEILYAGAGFLNIRREAYQKVQNDLNLQVCNERFGAPMIPFFQPMIREIEDAHWYLAEDYAFCERARSCGLVTYADTSVRLWHIGNYRYGWEDAGMDRPRFSNFTMSFKDTKTPRTETTQNNRGNLLNLASRFPWPDTKPDDFGTADRLWILPSVRQALADTIKVDDHCVVELGCWIGRTCRLISELAGLSQIICLDPWIGYPFAQKDEEAEDLEANLYEKFLHESWDIRQRVIPVRKQYMDGLREIADSGIEPNVVFFNAISDSPELLIAVTAALDLFPQATLIGHCFDRLPIAQELEKLREQRRLRLDTLSTAWRIGPQG